MDKGQESVTVQRTVPDCVDAIAAMLSRAIGEFNEDLRNVARLELDIEFSDGIRVKIEGKAK